MNAPTDGPQVPWWVWFLLVVTYFVPLAGAFAWLGYSELGWPGVLIASLKVLMASGALVGVLWSALGWPRHVNRPIPTPFHESIFSGIGMALWFAFVLGLEGLRPPAALVGRREAT